MLALLDKLQKTLAKIKKKHQRKQNKNVYFYNINNGQVFCIEFQAIT